MLHRLLDLVVWRTVDDFGQCKIDNGLSQFKRLVARTVINYNNLGRFFRLNRNTGQRLLYSLFSIIRGNITPIEADCIGAVSPC